jgi:anti-sigma28 factor (negative regulator of flagellin synthesis)
MTVSGSDNNGSHSRKIQEQVVADQSKLRSGTLLKRVPSEQGRAAPATSLPQGGESVSVQVSSLAVMLQDQLSPERMAAERSAKIAALKQQIANNSYAPNSEAVARAVLGDVELASILGEEL